MPASLARNSTNVRQMMWLAWQRVRFQVTSTLTPRVAVEEAAKLFTTPPRIPHTAKERAFLQGGERFEVRDQDLSLVAWRFGARNRPVVLLSHGWGGRGANWRAITRR